jgi:hypothetical protein
VDNLPETCENILRTKSDCAITTEAKGLNQMARKLAEKDQRQLTIRIDGPLAKEGKVPVGLLASKLQSAQRMLLSIGTSLVGGGRTGKFKDTVLRACELDFVSADKKCLQITTEIPPSEELFEEQDIGLKSLERFSETLHAAESKDRKRIEELYPDRGQRVRVIRAALAMFPEEESDYEIHLKSNGVFHLLSPELAEYLDDISRPSEPEYFEESIQTLTGILYLIEVETGELRIGIKVGNRKIVCHYPAELEDLIKDLIPGSLIEVEGRISVGENEQVKEVDEVIDARQIQLIPLYWSRLTYGDQKFSFSERLVITVGFQDGIWSHENELLGILGYGETRAESLEAFREDFTASWDSIAQEDDGNLSDDAIELKKKLRILVSKVEDIS